MKLGIGCSNCHLLLETEKALVLSYKGFIVKEFTCLNGIIYYCYVTYLQDRNILQLIHLVDDWLAL